MRSRIKVIQLLPTLSYGDGVGNDVLVMDAILKRYGYKTRIYAENIDNRISRDIVCRVEEMPRLRRKDVILYHLSTGSVLNDRLKEWTCRKIIVYHNVTPPHFFQGYSNASMKLCSEGRRALKELRDVPDYCLADSSYNRQELLEMGYSCPIDVLPILVPFQNYEAEPGGDVMRQYSGDGYINILFTGRICPNKKQEDVIEAFAYYQKYFNRRSRLFLAGSYQGMEKYQAQLEGYAEALEAENVVFTGHIPFKDILAYYHLSDLFLCMSEHEGFCIPLVEAMLFKLPIIAFDSTGVTGTLGSGGILLKEKKPLETAGLIHYVLSHPELKEQLVTDGQKQMEEFRMEKTEKMFIKKLQGFIERG